MNAVHFEDAVSRGAHPIDIHTAGDTTQKCQFLKNAAYIPYRSLIVPGFDNLLVAGRCFSADQVASASVRVPGLGDGAGPGGGLCAAQCACAGTSVHKADVHTLQAMLRKWGALI